MKVAIDKFGRILIPKSLRSHLGIKPGALMEITGQDHTILLRLIEPTAPLIRKGTALIFTGEATEDIDNAIEHERHRRLDNLFQK